MNLTSAATSFASLVNVLAVTGGGIDRVEPGNPNQSYLVHKIEGTQTVGVRMPAGGAPLDAATIAAIRLWITNGATL